MSVRIPFLCGIALLLAGSVAVAGDSSIPAKSGADTAVKKSPALVPQKTCPVMEGAINKNQYADVKGYRIYVCCPGCIEPIKKDPDKYIKILNDRGESVEKIPAKGAKGAAKAQSAAPDAAPAPAAASGGGALVPQKSCPLTGEAIDKKSFADIDGKRIYVCCDGCLTALKKDPQKAIKDLAAKGESVEILSK